jgi:hypothetical protein
VLHNEFLLFIISHYKSPINHVHIMGLVPVLGETEVTPREEPLHGLVVLSLYYVSVLFYKFQNFTGECHLQVPLSSATMSTMAFQAAKNSKIVAIKNLSTPSFSLFSIHYSNFSG